MTATLSVEGLSGGYGSLAVFRDVGFAVAGDDIMGILGPNGAGKTTLLKTLAGLLPAHSGRIVFAGADVGNLQAHSRAQQGLVLVPEGRQILAGLSVRENLELSRAGRRLNTAAFNARRDEVLTIFPRLSERLDQPGGSLSGGEQQMLAIARALLLDPRVLLLDEPTQGVDVGARADIYAQIRGAILEGAAAILVSSDFDELLMLADRILVLANGRSAGEAPTTSIDRHWLAERVYAIPQEVSV
jgi:ABC-type branched-subunit amino acid transport system ATPase component